MKNNIHVIYDKNGWKVKKENIDKDEYFDTKKDAIKYAKELAKKEQIELIIHKKDGIIKEKNSYGNDLYPPKG